ncbi:hypothetical protein IKG24_00865 [Candidatus Saccharibacteria bacterium]|nr:hypothetical protein [Candidatus Saccharibacteria bacterium]
MGIIVNKEDNKNNDLERRITSDLRAKAADTFEDGEVTDFAGDAEYIRDTKKTGRFAWVWIVLIVLAIISLVIIFMPASRN